MKKTVFISALRKRERSGSLSGMKIPYTEKSQLRLIPVNSRSSGMDADIIKRG
jgi:hypothetical protein